MRITIVVALLVAATAASARAQSVTATADESATLDGIGVGIELGEPTSVAVSYLAPNPRVGGKLSVGSGTMSGTGLQLVAEVSYVPLVLNRASRVRIPLRVGLGGRYYRHGFAPASIDELDDRHVGVRASLGAGVALMDLGLEVYLEVAPGYDLARTDSCNLSSGAFSVCPHQMSSRAFVHGVVGVRYYLGL